MTKPRHTLYLSLGSNLGDREGSILRAIALIGERVGEVVRRSSLLHTEPWGFESPNGFVNAAVCCLTELSPREALLATQQIERELGRTLKSTDGHYHDRPIDIDLLTYDDIRVEEPDLKIPHPLMGERDFVLKPLREIL